MPNQTLKPVNYEQITVSTAAKGFTTAEWKPATGRTANVALVRVAGANVRWRDDGTDPTASVGVPLKVDETLGYDGDLSAIKFIRSGAADATLEVSYYYGY